MISTCAFCKRDVKAMRTDGGTLIWEAMADGKATCDKRPYTTDPMLHDIYPPSDRKDTNNANR